MSLLIAALILLLLGLVIVVLSAPLRAARRAADVRGADLSQAPGVERGVGSVVAADGHELEARDALEALGELESRDALEARGELEAEREAKYREIRDVELDYRTGKLSRADYEAIDAELRREALEILNRIEAADRARGDRA